ncbi:glycosyltransferase family 4 protein [Avibacterium avium]
MLDLINGFTNHYPIPCYSTSFDKTLSEYKKIYPKLINLKIIPKKLRPIFFNSKLQKRKGLEEYLIGLNPIDNADLLICGGTHTGYLKAMKKHTSIRDFLINYRYKKAYQSANKIMAHSELMKKELIEFYHIPQEKIDVIYPPIDTEKFYPDNQLAMEARKEYGFNQDEVIFLFPSTGHKRKGLYILANYFANTDLPIKLVVAGSKLRRPLKNVIELGFCKNMANLYRACDFTIMAPRYEPFGLVGIESILCGTKVIFPEEMGCAEVIKKDAGFFYPLKAIAQELPNIIENAVNQKRQNKHKIIEPLHHLNYDPNLSTHINRIMDLVNQSLKTD